MSLVLDLERAGHLTRYRGALDVILRTQTKDGAIPWYDDGPWDPWNHSECLMALMAMGEHAAAEAGFAFLRASQAPDGSWLGEFGNAVPMADRLHMARVRGPTAKDTNFAGYPAVAVWRRWRRGGDLRLLKRDWPMVRAAIDFVIAQQSPFGDISWCAEVRGTEIDDSLLAGNACLVMSIACAEEIADAVGAPRPDWRRARARLARAVKRLPERFDRQGVDRSTFAMDWYYPVLAGVVDAAPAHARIDAKRSQFVRDTLGCHCVIGEPWVTVAESCELAMALHRIGLRDEAKRLLALQHQHRDLDGAYWMGFQYAEEIPWPQEKPSWTQAAVILAADLLQQPT